MRGRSAGDRSGSEGGQMGVRPRSGPRSALFVWLAICAGGQPARAQTRVYVSGDLFAEMPKFSRLVVSPDDFGSSDSTVPPDSVSVGGGGRVGAFLSPEWSLELGVDLGRTISHTRTTTIRGLAGLSPAPVPQQFTSGTSNRYSATSVLLGYHPPAAGRVHAGFRGGLSFMHRVGTFVNATVSTTTSFTTVSPSFPPLPVTTLIVTASEYSSIGNVITATVGAEAAVDVSDHFAIVPEVRVHAGGIGAILVRPGVSARWRW